MIWNTSVSSGTEPVDAVLIAPIAAPPAVAMAPICAIQTREVQAEQMCAVLVSFPVMTSPGFTSSDLNYFGKSV